MKIVTYYFLLILIGTNKQDFFKLLISKNVSLQQINKNKLIEQLEHLSPLDFVLKLFVI